MILRFGTWNIQGNISKDISKLVGELLLKKRLDFLVLTECEDSFVLPPSFKQYQIIYPNNHSKRIAIVSKKTYDVSLKTEDDKFMVLNLRQFKIFVFGVHFPCKIGGVDNSERIRDQLSLIKNCEEIIGLENDFIITGDFNCDPYHKHLVNDRLLNAVLFKNEIRYKKNNLPPMHYNPTYVSLSELNCNYGSYYFRDSDHADKKWEAIDQVIVSERLCDKIHKVQFLNNIGSRQLVKENKIDTSISDHLPLIFDIEGVTQND